MNVLDSKTFIDHINHNKIDNRKANLRLCTCSENNKNTLTNYNTISGFPGVWKAKKRWTAIIKVNGKRIYLGIYLNKDDAIKAKLLAEKLYFGEFAPHKKLYEQYGIKQ